LNPKFWLMKVGEGQEQLTIAAGYDTPPPDIETIELAAGFLFPGRPGIDDLRKRMERVLELEPPQQKAITGALSLGYLLHELWQRRGSFDPAPNLGGAKAVLWVRGPGKEPRSFQIVPMGAVPLPDGQATLVVTGWSLFAESAEAAGIIQAALDEGLEHSAELRELYDWAITVGWHIRVILER
jgi:hypothetical protein